MTHSDDEDVKDDYKPNCVSMSTIKAIESEEEKEENNKIYVYFDLPSKLRGDEISFKINYSIDDDSKYEDISLPLVLSKSSIPTSFRIITTSTISDEKYESLPSELITIEYPKQLSVLIDFIHNTDEAVKVEFEENIDFNRFKN